MKKLEDEMTLLSDRYEEEAIEEVRNFLCGYQLCLDMLSLRRYERKRANVFRDSCDCEDILAGGDALWRARMTEIGELIGCMKNSREKLMLHYHYVRGESIEFAADMLGVSRRTAYRVHRRALLMAAELFKKRKKGERWL